MGKDVEDVLFGDSFTPTEQIRRARIVVERNSGAILKNAYGRIEGKGSIAAHAIKAAHERYRAAEGTPYEHEAYGELARVVAAIAGKR